MQILLVTLLSLFSFTASAQNIQVMVDGVVYQCSGNGGEKSCAEKTSASLNKYSACKKAGNYPSECFGISFPSNPSNKKCSDWSQACNQICRESGKFASECFDYCY